MPRKLRILLAEVVGLGLLIGWLMWKYPELVDDIVPWIALLVLWHFTWELLLDTKFVRRWAVGLHKAVRPMIAWSLVFLAGGVISLLYWWGINKSMMRLATIAAARTAKIKALNPQPNHEEPGAKINPHLNPQSQRLSRYRQRSKWRNARLFDLVRIHHQKLRRHQKERFRRSHFRLSKDSMRSSIRFLFHSGIVGLR